MIFRILISTVCLLAIACSTLMLSEKDLTLSYVEQLQLGKMNFEIVIRDLGEPYREIRKNGEIYLVYLNKEKKGQKVIFTFDSEGILRSKYWNVSGHEKESNIDFALAKYPKSQFEIIDEKWVHHYEPSGRVYLDKTAGISIVVNKFKSYVEAISWFEPEGRGSSPASISK